jgi:DNA-binding response OmpR family regulator
MKNTILVVDDDEQILRALSLRLEAAGYDVLTASDGANGLDTALAQHPNVIVMDICMPLGGGFAVLEGLRRLKQDQVPVIFVTAFALPSLKGEALDLGAVAVFEKPYDFAQLRLVIDRLLGGNLPTAPRGALVPVRPKSPDRPPVVLIVEDDPQITFALSLRLRAAGHIALTAPDGVDGLRLAVAHRPDLIVMDIWTPASTGISVAKHLKEVGLGEIPIIFMTASKAVALRRQALEAGGIAFFEKPYDGEALLETIEQSLRRTRMAALAA